MEVFGATGEGSGSPVSSFARQAALALASQSPRQWHLVAPRDIHNYERPESTHPSDLRPSPFRKATILPYFAQADQGTNLRGLIMKWMHVPLAVAAVCLCGNLALAQQTGDQVVVTVAARAELRNNNVSTGTIPRGAILSVERADGNRFWVRWSDRDGTVKGWIARRDVLPLPQAFGLFDAELKKNPSALNYQLRGRILAAQRKGEKAMSDLDEAIRLNPRDAVAFRERGRVWWVKGENDKALADFDEAVRLDPKDAVSYRWRAALLSSWSVLDKAYADSDTAARLDPQNPDAFIGAETSALREANGNRPLPTARMRLNSIRKRPIPTRIVAFSG